MYFKRPSFRRGGNIGGGIMSGTNMGTRTGFQNPVIDFLNTNILGRNTQINNNHTGPISQISQKKGIEQILSGTDTRGSVNTLPQTIEELYKKREELYKKRGEKLKRSGDYIGSLVDNTYKDREGNTRDRVTGEIITDTSTSSGIAEIVSEGAAGDQITMLSDEAKGAATEALLKSIEEKKKRVEPGSDNNSITLDPYEEIKKEKDFLSKMLKNEGLERGEIALIAAKAIGTEGSFKDKLDAAVDLALPVVRARNKEDKALTLTAYKSFKEKEKAQAKAQADANKPTVGMKELQYQANMILKSGDKSRGDTQDEVITSLISEKFKSPDQTLRRETLVRAQEKVFESFDDLKDSKKAYDDYVKTKYLDKEKEIDVTDKKLINLQRQIDENLNIFKLFYDVPEFSEQYPAYVDAFNRLGLKEGGRVKRALGSPDTGEQIITSETETIGAETAQKPVLKLTYDDLRNRLPQEITDDVVELLANSEEALQDFAYIQTQNDVDSFNIKYGVNLIIPPAPQTA
jgi:hypothetical protein